MRSSGGVLPSAVCVSSVTRKLGSVKGGSGHKVIIGYWVIDIYLFILFYLFIYLFFVLYVYCDFLYMYVFL